MKEKLCSLHEFLYETKESIEFRMGAQGFADFYNKDIHKSMLLNIERECKGPHQYVWVEGRYEYERRTACEFYTKDKVKCRNESCKEFIIVVEKDNDKSRTIELIERCLEHRIEYAALRYTRAYAIAKGVNK